MVRLLLLQLCLIIGTAPIVASAGEVKFGDDITAGIQTRAEHDIRPFGYRVTWINWDSYFRDSDLRLGDRILGVNGERYRPETHNLGYAIGNHAENWADSAIGRKFRPASADVLEFWFFFAWPLSRSSAVGKA